MKISDKTWSWGSKTYVMGILNVTPDSFSDGGKFNAVDLAIKQALTMEEHGADIIDVGGESTRPGSQPVQTDEEIQRVVPIIKELSVATGLPISVDTYRARTAEAAVKAGAHLINDIWGLKHDPELADVAARYQTPVCLMHNRVQGTGYQDIITDMQKELSESIDIAIKAGIRQENIIIDPGIGFAKTWDQNLMVMRHLEDFKKLGFPILLGASRKSFIGKVLDLEVTDRLEGTLAVTAAGIMKGIDVIRVHDVLENVRVARMTDAIVR